MSAMKAAFKQILSSTKVGDFLSRKDSEASMPRKLVSINSKSTLAEALKVLNDNMIISVPIIDGENCVGIIDNIDIINYLNKQFENIREWLANSEVSVEGVFSEVLVSEVVDFAHGDPFVVTSENATIQSVMKFFASGWSHRCVVKTKEGYAILTQYDIVKLLADSMQSDKNLYELCEAIFLLDRLNSRSLSDETITIGSTASVFEALDRMIQKQVHALAVVDETDDGRIVGNFSATDLLNVGYGQFKEFSLSVYEFLEKYSPASLTPVTVEADWTSLANVLDLFSKLGLHRLWIVDSESQASFPIGVVTLTDVLKIVNQM